MSLKFLLGIAVLNTALFAVAKIVGVSIWWVLAAELLLFSGYVMVKAWRDPTQQLVNQGAHMGWVAAGTVRDENGWRDMLMKRGGMVVRVSYSEKGLYVVEPAPSGPYKDFLEIEGADGVTGRRVRGTPVTATAYPHSAPRRGSG